MTNLWLSFRGGKFHFSPDGVSVLCGRNVPFFIFATPKYTVNESDACATCWKRKPAHDAARIAAQITAQIDEVNA